MCGKKFDRNNLNVCNNVRNKRENVTRFLMLMVSMEIF